MNPNDAPEEIRYATIVGVVEHMRVHDLREPYLPQMFWPSTGLPQFSVVVRATGNPLALVPRVKETIGRLAVGAPVEDVRTLDDLVQASVAPERLALALMSLFGLTALLLACVGVYGVLANLVTQRTREIGIRMALGQSPHGVQGEVVRHGMRLVAAALVVGLACALGLSRVLTSGLYGVLPWDPTTYAVACLVLGAVAALACWIPARRATGIDPGEAMRAE